MPGPAPRPILKLKVGGSSSGDVAGNPASRTPGSTSTPKLKLKFGGAKTPSTEVPPVSTPASDPTTPKIKFVSKKARPTKTLKLISSKKREYSDVDDPTDGTQDGGTPKIKKIKLRTSSKGTPTTPFIKFKGASKGITRPPGEAYDEIASDCENDPWISEGFILRMQPGDDCEYIRKAIENKQWGPRSRGGADVKLKFYTVDGRRASLTIRGKIYACVLVDLPCMVEAMKSWDKRSWYKSADICQMLLVLGTVKDESEIHNYPLPHGDVDAKTMQYAHGLTPPMRWVRKRRFRKRISLKTIEAVEEEVDRLLAMDDDAMEPVTFHFVDPDKPNQPISGRQTPRSDAEYDDNEADAEGEEVEPDGYFDLPAEEEDEDALAAQFELAMQEGEVELEAETPADSSTAAAETQPVTDSEAATPGAGHTSKDEDSGDEESDDDDADDMDEDAMEERAGLQRQQDEIEELRMVIKEQTADMERTTNTILKKKKAERVQNLKEELRVKQAAIGEEEDDA